jgi:hypothetical protein
MKDWYKICVENKHLPATVKQLTAGNDVRHKGRTLSISEFPHFFL